MKRIAIVQSNYIPWKGYFDLIRAVDEFVLYDDAQYTRRDWRNRARIHTSAGPRWLTIPVKVKGKFTQRIRDVEISDPTWAKKHWNSIRHAYARATYFHEYRDFFEELYLNTTDSQLSKINFRFLTAICQLLDIKTSLSWSMDYELPEGPTDRLVAICCQAGADSYLSGPSAREYIEVDKFSAASIALSYADYSGYAEYTRVHESFDHGVSAIDLIFAEGPRARSLLKDM